METVITRLHQLCDTTDTQKIVHDHIKEKISSVYKECFDYLDSKQDKDVLQFLMSKITSIMYTAELKGVQNRDSVKASKAYVNRNLALFKELKFSLQEKYSDLQASKKEALIRRRLEAAKLQTMRHTYQGTKGRKLKCVEFSDLAVVLEFEFSEGDRIKRGGGGLESHPKLRTNILYKAEDGKTKMKDARQSILAVAPPNFKISLSSCYNYTMNFKKGTYQLKRHHENMGINPNISLHRPPDVMPLKQHVVNIHWSSANVNYLVDHAAANSDSFLVDSKDAKAKIRSGKTSKASYGLNVKCMTIIMKTSFRTTLLRQCLTFSLKQLWRIVQFLQ